MDPKERMAQKSVERAFSGFQSQVGPQLPVSEVTGEILRAAQHAADGCNAVAKRLRDAIEQRKAETSLLERALVRLEMSAQEPRCEMTARPLPGEETLRELANDPRSFRGY